MTMNKTKDDAATMPEYAAAAEASDGACHVGRSSPGSASDDAKRDGSDGEGATSSSNGYEEWDMSPTARKILKVLARMKEERNGGAVIRGDLLDLWNWGGATFSVDDKKVLFRAMVRAGILREIHQEVRRGENAASVEDRSRPFLVRLKKKIELVLPNKLTDALLFRMKRLVNMWAEEEQMAGKNVFYWNIMGSMKMEEVARLAPTTMEELSEIKFIEGFQEKYGERLIKNIKAFIESENLHHCIEVRPKKKQRTAPAEAAIYEGKPKGNDPVFIDADKGVEASEVGESVSEGREGEGPGADEDVNNGVWNGEENNGSIHQLPGGRMKRGDGKSGMISESNSEEDEESEQRKFEPFMVWRSPHEGGEARGLPPRLTTTTRPDEYGAEETVTKLVSAPAEAYAKESTFVPPVLAKYLRAHQREGVAFMYECVMGLKNFNGAGCILADDMGLGKTLQTITLIWTLLQTSIAANKARTAKRVIVVCSCSYVKDWENQFVKWLGPGTVKTLALAESNRRAIKKNIGCFVKTKKFNVLIASYETIRTHVGRLNKYKDCCDLLVCDEAHRLKNRENQTTMALNSIPVKRRVLLTGKTGNDLKETFAMADFANPGVLGTPEEFRKNIYNPILRGRRPGATETQKQRMVEVQQEMSSSVNHFILRRANALNGFFVAATCNGGSGEDEDKGEESGDGGSVLGGGGEVEGKVAAVPVGRDDNNGAQAQDTLAAAAERECEATEGEEAARRHRLGNRDALDPAGGTKDPAAGRPGVPASAVERPGAPGYRELVEVDETLARYLRRRKMRIEAGLGAARIDGMIDRLEERSIELAQSMLRGTRNGGRRRHG